MKIKLTGLAVIVFLIVSCMSVKPSLDKPEGGRQPAEVFEDPKLEQLFLNHWEGKNSSFDDYFSRLVAIFLRAHKYSLDFDAELDRRIKNKKAGEEIEPMTNSVPYKKLYVMKLLTYSIHDKITYIYERLMQQACISKTTAQEKMKAHGMMANMLSAIRKKWANNPEGRLEMVGLFREMQTIRQDVLESYGMSQTTEDEKRNAVFLNKKPEDYYKEFKEAKESINQKATLEAQTADDEFELVYKSVILSTEREPNNVLALMPSSGASGNTSGNDFPKGVWALTYDDGPHATHTPKILEMLKDNGVKATFFWLAKLVKNSSAIVGRAKSNGHELANHSYSHADLARSSTDRQREISDSTKILTAAYGAAPAFFRCPYGSCIFNSSSSGSKEARALIAGNYMIHVLWNVDSNDWKADTPDVIFRRTRDQINNLSRGIILFHDVHERSYLASKRLVEEVLKNKNMVLMSDVVKTK